MVIDMNIDIVNGSVDVMEESEFGTKKEKRISLDEFLQQYTSLIKEKEDNNKFIFFPPGTVEYKKNLNSCTFVVQTNPYKEYYGLLDDKDDYLLIVKMNVDCNLVLGYRCYKTEGPFNKRLSSFVEIDTSDNSFAAVDESEAIKLCLSKIDKNGTKIAPIHLSYKNILKNKSH